MTIHFKIYLFFIIFFTLFILGMLAFYAIEGYIFNRKTKKITQIREFIDELDEVSFQQLNNITIPNTVYLVYGWERDDTQSNFWKLLIDNKKDKDILVNKFKKVGIDIVVYEFNRNYNI